jgi:alkaline phosphatase D
MLIALTVVAVPTVYSRPFPVELPFELPFELPSERLSSGPMLGHIDFREATIWLQTVNESNVQIKYRTPNTENRGEKNKEYSTATIRTTREQGYTAKLVCDSVEPGTTYTYDVYVNGSVVPRPYPTTFTTPAVWKWRPQDPPTFTCAIGSCTYVNEERFDRPGTPYGSDYSIFTSIHALRPDIMIWLGDNTYLREPDWNSRSGIYHRWTHTRALPELQPLLASTAHYAIWDDHDYGPNDADRSYWAKDITLEAFSTFWCNPSAGVMGKPGITTTFERGDVQFFLLDDRYYRSPNGRTTGDRTILGEHQIQWLIDALAASTATFKIVAVGSQFLTDNLRKECFARMPEERARIIDLITKEKISGVVFISGDIHASELSKLDRPGTYPLYEFTCSSLTAGANTKIAEQSNTYRVAGTEVGQHNFGTLTFSGAKGARTLTMRTFDINGKQLWERVLSESDLR